MQQTLGKYLLPTFMVMLSLATAAENFASSIWDVRTLMVLNAMMNTATLRLCNNSITSNTTQDCLHKPRVNIVTTVATAKRRSLMQQFSTATNNRCGYEFTRIAAVNASLGVSRPTLQWRCCNITATRFPGGRLS